MLSLEGIPFREAHIKVSNLTMKLKKQGKVLSDLNSKELNEILDVDFNLKIDLSRSINSRKLKGGTSKAQVKKEIITAKKILKL